MVKKKKVPRTPLKTGVNSCALIYLWLLILIYYYKEDHPPVGHLPKEFLFIQLLTVVIICCIKFVFDVISLNQLLAGPSFGRDRMVVGFTTTDAISGYHHWWCEFESRSGRGVQHYVIKFVSDLRQVGGNLRVLRFPPPIKQTSTI
jgi:hypothetical protein